MSHSEYKTGEECMEALRGLSSSAEGICQHAINYVYRLEQRIKKLEKALIDIRDYDGNVGEGNYQADEMRRIARQILENKGKEKKL